MLPISPTHCLVAPISPVLHITHWPCHTAALCLYPSGSNRKTGKNREWVLQAHSFPYCTPRVFLGYTWLLGSPTWTHSRRSKCWCGAGPFCFPTWSHSEPHASLHPWLFAECLDSPLFWGCSRFRRAQTEGGKMVHPFGEHKQSQEKGVLRAVKAYLQKDMFDNQTKASYHCWNPEKIIILLTKSLDKSRSLQLAPKEQQSLAPYGPP